MSNFEPKNRPDDDGGLSALDIDVTSAIGKDRYDPNSLVMAAAKGDVAMLTTVDGLKSDISAEPAVLYRTAEIRLQLTPAELARLTLRNLEPHEFLSLLATYGDFYEIHDDFYDHQSGVSLQ